jgi:rfaE bifunctional protein kinase chain/domain
MNKLDFSNLKILIVGDVMIDHYIYGRVERISPEAPVPVVQKESFEYRLGGASNVALNIKTLGATPIIIGVVGEDYLGDIMTSLLEDANIIKHYLVKDDQRQTTLKSRVIAKGQQLLRIDNEIVDDIPNALADDIFNTIKDIIMTLQIDGIVLQDYNKGLLTPYLIRAIIDFSNIKRIPIIVDPKFKNFELYQDATILKPNKKEVETALGHGIDPNSVGLFDELQKLRSKMNLECLFTTLSKSGIAYVTKDEQQKIKANSRNIVDVCGAGDTVLSMIACSYLSGLSYQEIAVLSNISGGLSCEIPGVSQINIDQVKIELQKQAKSIL